MDMKVAAVAGLALLFLVTRRRKRAPKTSLEKARSSVESVFGEIDSRSHELREKARKASGEARKRLEAQLSELEEKQHELRSKLEELGSEAKRLTGRNAG